MRMLCHFGLKVYVLMKPKPKFTFYTTGLRKSDAVGEVIAINSIIRDRIENFNFKDIPIVYGVLAGAGELMRKCRIARHPFVHIDNGYFNPGYLTGYYRVTHNAHRVYHSKDSDPTRFNNLDIELSPFRAGKYIVICAPSELGCYANPYEKLSVKEWIDCTIARVRKQTSSPIIVTHKQGSKYTLKDVLDEANFVIGCSSNSVVEALTNGIPAIDAAPWVTNSLNYDDLVIDPIVPRYWTKRRQDYFYCLANNQFKLNEITQETLTNGYIRN